MNLEEAKSYVGKEVWSRDTQKMVRYGPPHGPWVLVQVTKGGIARLKKVWPKDHTGGNFIEYRHVPPSCLLPPPETNPT
jgi:hypothetical protein